MKHVNAYPFVGKDYEKGFLNSGKKVLILGHSHYDADSAGCPCHHSFTIDMMDGFLSGEDGAFYKGFTSQTKALMNREISVDDREYVWNQVAFYNFIQFNLEAPGVKETDEQFNDSIPAFKEVLEELKPDVIIGAMVSSIDFMVLGKRMEKKCLLPMVIRFIPVGFLPVVKTRL